jgi:2-methylcitrate dehydratase PrpD
MDLIYSLADHVVKTDFEALPKEVVEKTKLFTLDSLGLAMAGSRAPGVPQVAELMAERGGRPESTVYYFGHTLTAMDAALVNSMMIHALDFDDLNEEAVVHPSCVQVPVAFAIAEQRRPVHGRDLITAMALGTDISCRLGLGLASGTGFVRSGTCGIFGAVANAAKLRNCTHEEIVNAMGIAFSQSAGNLQAVLDGALVKRMQPGFMARDGIFSVLLAERGISGPKATMEGKYGFLELYKRGGIYPERISKDLGKIYEGANVSVKPYPGGRFTHGPAEMGIDMAKEHNLIPEQISEIKIYLNKKANEYVGRPYDPDRGNPQVMAQFCAAYAVAAGIVRRDLFIGEFEEKVIKDRTIGELARKVQTVVDDSFEDPATKTTARLVIKTKDGRTLSKKVQYPKGHPSNFLSKEEFTAKFRKCLDYCSPKIKEEKIEKVIDLIGRLEDIPDVGGIPRLLIKEDS